jgi:hypothetical protein
MAKGLSLCGDFDILLAVLIIHWCLLIICIRIHLKET